MPLCSGCGAGFDLQPVRIAAAIVMNAANRKALGFATALRFEEDKVRHIFELRTGCLLFGNCRGAGSARSPPVNRHLNH